MKIMLDDGAFLPERAHDTDAGLDLRTPIAFTLSPGIPAVVHTGVHVELPHGTAGVIMAKSGLNVRKDIITTGLIDEGYTGEIVVKLYSFAPWGSTHFEVGDKIAQLVVMPVLYEDVEVVDRIKGGARGDGAFGSTGR